MASASADQLVRVVREALRDAASLTTETVGWDGIDPLAFADAVIRHRVADLLVVRQAAIVMPEQIAANVHELAIAGAHGGLLLMRRTIEVSYLMNRVGITHLVIKGVPLSIVTSGRAVSRGAGDVDLLVREPYVFAGQKALLSDGFRRWNGRVGPRFLVADHPLAGTRAALVTWPRGGRLHWRVAYHDSLLPQWRRL